MPRPKDVLTTGEVARICNVAPRTVSKWFDTGKLRGYRIPGSKDRRIPLQQLIRFMRAHGIPLDGLDTGVTRILIVEADPDLAELLSSALAREAGYEIRTAATAFEAGVAAENLRPHVVFMDIAVPGLSGREILRRIRSLPEMAETRLIAVTGLLQEGDAAALQQEGFDAVLSKPFEIGQVVKIVEDLMTPAS